MTRLSFSPLIIALALTGCSPSGASSSGSDGKNPFLDAEGRAVENKFDTGWVSSLDAVEVELDLEGDVEASDFFDAKAPLRIGQYALTYLRNNTKVFVQSLAEDYANGTESVEWLVGTEWKRGNDPAVAAAKPTHFRLRGVSAVVLEPEMTDEELATASFEAIVPRRPSKLFAEAGAACGTAHGDIEVEQGVYWYVWEPGNADCSEELKQTVELKVSKVLPRGGAAYPEYDRLLEDRQIDAAVFFGQVGHGTLDETDLGFSLIREFVKNLEGAGFAEEADGPGGQRFVRQQNGVRVVVDIYTPFEFSGLTDYAKVENFDAAVSTHEIVVWNGHSVLGASDFWARDEIYSGAAATKYQIFLYNGCLGYAYYVNPILEGKQGWDNVDLVTNTIETPFSIVVDETSAALGLIVGGAESGGTTSWQTILTKMNDISSWSGYYGASGVRTNGFQPPNP